MHRIPRTLHVGFFVRTPFPRKILAAQEKVVYEMQWQLSYRAFIYSIHGRCREHALALTHRRICEKSQNSPILIAISDGDIYRWKAEYAMIYHLSKLYMAIIIIAVEWTLNLAFIHLRRLENRKKNRLQTPFPMKISTISKNWEYYDMPLIKSFHII